MSILFGPGESPFQSSQRRQNRSIQNQKSSTTTSKHEDLLVFGYQCKFFRDDATAQDVNSGKTLIPWMGNKDIMIDRYDCRGHLYRLEDFDFSSNACNNSKLTSEEIDIESILDEERYRDLGKDNTEDEILEEEAEKRSKALYDPYTAYQSINYSYDDSQNSGGGKTLADIDNNKPSDDVFKQYCQYYGYDHNDSSVKDYFEAYQKQQQYENNRPPPPPAPTERAAPVAEEKGPEPFLPPKGIDIPDTMEVPETRRMQSIIEKTATFLSKQSGQMEIVLKTKQAGNPQFNFLNFDDYMNPYYKFILEKIKNGSYTPGADTPKDEPAKIESEEKNSETAVENTTTTCDKKTTSDDNESDDNDSDDDSDNDDEGELHPLLQAHRRPVAKPEPAAVITTAKIAEATHPPVERKPLRRPEDLTKIYMSMKYKSNPEPEDLKDESSGDPPPPPSVPQQQHFQDFQHCAPPPPPPPPAAPQAVEYSNRMIDYRQQPPPHFQPPSNMFNPDMLPPPNMQQPLIGNNFRPHPQAFLPPPRGGQVPPLLQQPMGSFPPRPLMMLPPGVENMGMDFQGRPPMRPMYVNRPPMPPVSHLMSQPQMMPPPINNQPPVSFQTGGPIGPKLPPQDNGPRIPPQLLGSQYPQRKAAPQPGPQPLPNKELLPPGVDEIENCLPPPPPLPPTPSIDEISKLSTTTKNIQNKKIEREEENDHRFETSHLVQPPSHQVETVAHQVQPAHPDEEFSSENSRYRPSAMLSNILKSRGIANPPARPESPGRSIDYRDESDPYDSPRHYHSPYYNDSPVSRSPARDYYDSPRSDYDSSSETYARNDGISPFARLSESLKMLQQQPIADQPQPQPQQNSDTQQQQDPNASKPSVEPSADLQPVIKRLAQYVAKNGDEFETGIREKNDPRFDFLNHWNMYHGFYVEMKMEAREEMKREKQEEIERRKNLKVKFGLKMTKTGPVKKSKSGSHGKAAAIFNYEDDEEEDKVETKEVQNGINLGFKPNKDIDNALDKDQQVDARERGVNMVAAGGRRTTTPQQQAALKRKAQTELLRKDSTYKDGASSSSAQRASGDRLGNRRDGNDDFPSLAKRKFKDSSNSSVNTLSAPELITSKKQDAFHKAINDAFSSG